MVRLVAFGGVVYVISLVSVAGLLRRSARRDAAERAWLQRELPGAPAGESPDRPPLVVVHPSTGLQPRVIRPRPGPSRTWLYSTASPEPLDPRS
jgi:hypothetical protein